MADRRGQLKGSIQSEIDGGAGGAHEDIGTSRRAKWSHQMKLFLIGLLKEYDVPGYRTNHAWSKDAWTKITSRVNEKFGVSYDVNQVKQKEQDLKRDYRSVKVLVDESGFGWDRDRHMVDALFANAYRNIATCSSTETLYPSERSFFSRNL